MSQKVLSYDLGGTKVAVGVVNSRGRVLNEIRVPIQLEKGKNAVIQQLVDLGHHLLQDHPEVKKIGIASAGPLDPIRGILLDPTNFVTPDHKSWGQVPLVALMKKKLKRSVHLENDAAAAVLAEHWIGAGKKYRNLMILTLGTGLGTGIICNGSLVRSGRNLHPEAGHIILNYDDKTAPCGCGNFGCAESYLSGRNFELRFRKKWGGQTGGRGGAQPGRRVANSGSSFGAQPGKRGANPTSSVTQEISLSSIHAREIAHLARQKDPRAQEAFSEYAEIMAVAIHSYVKIYCPEIIFFTGSFAQSADLFIPKTLSHLKKLLTRERRPIDLLPKLEVSSLENQAGLIGGAYVALHSDRAGFPSAR